MGGARALIASLGASISLMAGAALSLLVVSFVFAYNGFTSDISLRTPDTALLVEQPAATAPSRHTAAGTVAPVVIRATPTPAVRPAEPKARPARPTRRDASTATRPTFDPGVRSFRPPATPASPATDARRPAIGDGVRQVGDAVGSTVQNTAKATAPLLGPPVSQAVQDVLDLLTRVLQGATGAVAGTLDNALPGR